MDLHTSKFLPLNIQINSRSFCFRPKDSHRFVCDTCGERYATHTGISKHACLNKKRRRPEVDFRIFDVRHCKFCGLSFDCLESNKAHECDFQFPEDPKMFRCRFCLIDMSKNSYNKHMSRHLAPDKEWICEFCNKKLSDEIGLNIHCESNFVSLHLISRLTLTLFSNNTYWRQAFQVSL